MKMDVLPDAESAARTAAVFIANQARQAIVQRGRFVVAFSGGSTPWPMLQFLADEDIPWQNVHVAQVDERVAPPGDPERNLTHLEQSLLAHTDLPTEQLYAMPVEAEDLVAAAAEYSRTLSAIASSPPMLDLVHLGLGADGHTASLVPGDAVLDVDDRDVALTGVYQGRQRMTLTFATLNRARNVLWLVTGSSKAQMLDRLRRGDPQIPAGRIQQENTTMVVDRAAADDPSLH